MKMNSEAYELIRQALILADQAELACVEEKEWQAMIKVGEAKSALKQAMSRTVKFQVELASELFPELPA
jgi:hypothetical protein